MESCVTVCLQDTSVFVYIHVEMLSCCNTSSDQMSPQLDHLALLITSRSLKPAKMEAVMVVVSSLSHIH